MLATFGFTDEKTKLRGRTGMRPRYPSHIVVNKTFQKVPRFKPSKSKSHNFYD